MRRYKLYRNPGYVEIDPAIIHQIARYEGHVMIELEHQHGGGIFYIETPVDRVMADMIEARDNERST
jgi:hypothetical protein